MAGVECRPDIIPSLMISLDDAYQRRLGLPPLAGDDWGRRFFEYLENSDTEWAALPDRVYQTASDLLGRYASLETGRELGWSIYGNPAAFLRAVLLILGWEYGSIPETGPARVAGGHEG